VMSLYIRCRERSMLNISIQKYIEIRFDDTLQQTIIIKIYSF